MYIPSPTLQKLFIFAGSTQRWKGKNQLSFSLYYQLFVWLSVQIRSNQNTQRIFLKCQMTSYKLLNYKGYFENSMGFPPKMVAKGNNFCKMWIGLFFYDKFLRPLPIGALCWSLMSCFFFVVVILNKLNSSCSSV